MRELADAAQREIIMTALDTSLLVEAAAGTGKTTALVGRIVAVLAMGHAELDRIVAVTFTEAAAGELKLRLRAAIEKARLDPTRPESERERLRAALPKLEEARVSTVHGFCTDLLKEHPVEAGVDPYFEVAAEDVAWALFERAFDRWFESQLAAPGPAVRRILRRPKREWSGSRDEGLRGALRQAAWQLVEHRDFPAPWRSAGAFDRDRVIDEMVTEMQSLTEWAPRGDPNDWFGKALIEIAKSVHEFERAERVRSRDYDGLEAWFSGNARQRYWEWKGFARPHHHEFPKDELRRRRDDLHARVKRFVDDAGAHLAPLLRDELWPVVEAFEAAKQRAGCLDFNDLLIFARNLIRDDAHVRCELQQRLTHFFVDEFQDTDPRQVEIVMLLAADDPDVTDWRKARALPGKLFLVGDPKQSVYRFRRADVELYREVQRQLIEQGARQIHLTVSFRSVPEIQEAVNAAFAPRFTASQGDYVPLAPVRDRYDSQPAVIALPVPAPYGDYRTVTNASIVDSLPDVVAAWIQWLIAESGWTVTERERPNVRTKVEPRHVCLLFRNLRTYGGDATRPYVEALEARGLRHLLVGGGSFHSREEVETLSVALAAIERPDDELAVFATLRGPLLAVSDAALLWRERVGALHPLRALPQDLPPSLVEVGQSLRLLRELHRGRNRRPVADTVTQLLEATRAYASFAIWPTGMQALANIGRFMDLARRAERGEVAEAPVLEEGVQGVRMMTAHKAKGLEFPVVMLVDMTTPAIHEQPSRWTDSARGPCVQRLANCTPPELREHSDEEIQREREEAVRLLYVASTRARDVLVVPVIGDERRDGWLATLHPAVYPQITRGRKPIARREAGTPEFGSESVPSRPEDVSRPPNSVMPGVHHPEAGSHRVIWWDPSMLTLGLKPSVGLAQEKILTDDGLGNAQAAKASWKSWREARSGIVERGERPSIVVETATERARASRGIDGAADVSVIDARWKGPRPSGPRFGTLVHALLAGVSLEADRGDITAHAEIQARVLGASDEERAAGVEVAMAALGHTLLRRAAVADGGGLCRRESGVVIRLDDGSLLECVVDLAFREANDWIIVDFKTDEDLHLREDVYRRQCALYVRGIADATGTGARGHLLLI